ncbi:MAG: hypothetical protein P1V20_03325 [Verrucomicrobiales bacterium]|nr:hypothetical protein [Verrucomicrobiales bacterium]
MELKARVENGKLKPVDPLPSEWEEGTQLVVVDCATHDRANEFQKLKETWQNETKYRSFSQQIALHPAYQRIIGMGRDALPLILRELQADPHHWFWALRSISGEDPVPQDARGDMNAMTKSWLDWGRKAGVI